MCVSARVELGGQEGGEGVRAGVGGEGEDMPGGFRADRCLGGAQSLASRAGSKAGWGGSYQCSSQPGLILPTPGVTQPHGESGWVRSPEAQLGCGPGARAAAELCMDLHPDAICFPALETGDRAGTCQSKTGEVGRQLCGPSRGLGGCNG